MPSELRVPTFERDNRFNRDYARLTAEEARLFRIAVKKFIADLNRGRFRKGLRIKGVEGQEGIFELTWAPDGRATFRYGKQIHDREPHIIWRRVGSHDILDEP